MARSASDRRSARAVGRCASLLRRVGALAGVPLVAWAQSAPPAALPPTSPSQVTPPTLRPLPREPVAPVAVPAAPGAEAPAGAEQLFVAPGAYAFSSESPELLALVRRVPLPAPGVRISVAEIFAVASRAEAALANAGYPLARVLLPAQAVVDGGAVNLVVIDGFIEALDLAALPEAAREPVRRRLAPLVGQRRLTLAELERRLLLAGEVPGLALRSALATGQQRGGTRLVLQGSFASWSGSLAADNRLGESLQRWQFGPTLALNNPLGAGAQLFATLRSGSGIEQTFGSSPRLRILAAGATWPVGVDGHALGGEFTDSVTQPIAAPGAPETRGHLQRGTLRASYSLQRSRAASRTATLALEALQQASEAPLFGIKLNEDRYAALRATLDLARFHDTGLRIDASATVTRGLGGRTAEEAAALGVPLSRQGAGPVFNKLGFSGQAGLPLPGLHATPGLPGGPGGSLVLLGSAQWAQGRALLQPEQFALDGATGVSGPPSGTLSVDSGAALRLEWRQALPLPANAFVGAGTIAPYVFAAEGRGRVARPTAVEQARVAGRSWGAGLRTEAGARADGFSHGLTLEWARYEIDSSRGGTGTRGALSYVLGF